jgi:hypothetical protein
VFPIILSIENPGFVEVDGLGLDVVEMDVDPLSRRGSDIAGSCPLLFISCVRNGKCDVIKGERYGYEIPVPIIAG